MNDFRDIKVGDTVTRMLAGTVPMSMRVTKVDDQFIHCGAADAEVEGWKFDRTFGYEVDEELGWGVPQGDDNRIITGSYLTREGEVRHA